MRLVKVAPDQVSSLSGSCREFAIQTVERAQEEGKVISLQARQQSSGLKLIFALSVLPSHAEEINKDGTIYWQPSQYLKQLRGNDNHDHGNQEVI